MLTLSEKYETRLKHAERKVASKYIFGNEQFGLGSPDKANQAAINLFKQANEIIEQNSLDDVLHVKRMLRRIHLDQMYRIIKEAEENLKRGREGRNEARKLYGTALELWQKVFAYGGHEKGLMAGRN